MWHGRHAREGTLMRNVVWKKSGVFPEGSLQYSCGRLPRCILLPAKREAWGG